jgi:hypothetical protein
VDATVVTFAAAVREASADPTLREKKTVAARATAQEYNWDKITPCFLDLYSKLAAQREIESLPEASFYSTAAQGARAAIMHHASQIAEGAFRMLASGPGSRKTLRRADNTAANGGD